MWRRVSCEQPLHTSQSILSPRRNPMQTAMGNALNSTQRDRDPLIGRKGIRFLFRNPAAEPLFVGPSQGVRQGNLKGPGDAVGGPGKSFLFCMSVRVPWNPLAGR